MPLPETESRSAPSRWKGRRPPLLIGTAVVLLLLAAAWLLTPGGQLRRHGRFGPSGQAVPVVAATATRGDMPVVLTGLGTVTPLATVTVRTQISGYLTAIGFKEGQEVEKGDFLAQIDPRPYEAVLEQAEGTLERDRALLANARLDLARYQRLVRQDSIAEQQRDTQKATVAQYEGTVRYDEGAVDSAKVNLAYCRIIAPVDGRVGLRQVDAGNYVTPSDTDGIVVITKLKPITVVFTLPEDSIPELERRLRDGVTLGVAAYDRTHTTKLAEGTLASLDNEIDTSTGTVKLKASFPNTGEALFPNQFVNADLLLDTVKNAVLVPQAAVQRGSPGTFVYVIGSDHKVSVRKIALGPGDATNVVVTKGLKAGEQVVAEGGDRLSDGAEVTLPGSASGAAASGTAAAATTDPAQPQRKRRWSGRKNRAGSSQAAPQ